MQISEEALVLPHRRARPRPRRSPWPLRLAVLHLALVGVVALLTRIVAERLWWTTLLLYFPQSVYALPALLVLPWAVRARHGWALLAELAALLVIGGPLMDFNLPGPPPAVPEGTPRVRVLAYNIHGATAGFALVEEQLDRFRPDVVVFSEARGFGRERKLRRELEERFEGWHSHHGEEVFIASRWPIIDRESEPFGPSRNRAKVRVLVDGPAGRFHVVGVHYSTSIYGQTIVKNRAGVPRYMRQTGEIRERQTQDLLRWIEDLEEPVIVAGDFNTPPAGSIYRRLTRELTDAFRARGTGWGYTYPSRLPLLRIDYVLHSREWATVSSRVGPAPGSDHRPVFAELALR